MSRPLRPGRVSVPGRRETELNEAQRLAGTGSWTWTAVTDVTSWSRGLYRIAGREPSGPAARLDTAGAFVAGSARRLADAVESCRTHLVPFEFDLDRAGPDGSVRWVAARGEPVIGSDGTLSGIRATVPDVTERRNAEDVVRRDLELVESLSRVAGCMAKRLDLEGVLATVCEETARAMNVAVAVFTF